jgi:hypothetical protein
MHCVPACHRPSATAGREMMEYTGTTTGVEVTGGVLESAASVVFGQAETARTMRAILIATLGYPRRRLSRWAFSQEIFTGEWGCCHRGEWARPQCTANLTGRARAPPRPELVPG